MSAGKLIEHMVGGLLQFASIPSSADATEALTPPADLGLTIDDAVAAFDNAGRKMLAAWKDPTTTNANYDMPWGATPGAALVGFMLIEVVTHGWDLAKATDQRPAFDDQLVLTTLEIARMYGDEGIRVPGMFGPIVPVADDAPLIDRLAGFLGRHP